MNKTLCIIGCLDVGGAETFLMKIFRCLDTTKYRIDFVVCTEKECAYNAEIRKLGGKIFVVTGKEKNPLKNYLETKKIVKSNKYLSVLKVSEYSIGAFDLLAAKHGGAVKRVFRSTNSNAIDSKIKLWLHKMLIPLVNYVTTERVAPSTEAAKFTFGEKSVNQKKVRYLNNGLKLSDYIIDEGITKKLKNQLGLEGKFIIGHIGRFSEQKNHKFILQVFSELITEHKDAHLVLVGDGELHDFICMELKRLNIEKYVSILGVRSDIPELLSIMDVILFPSLFEGMPNVLIEAQAEGIPCVISTNITPEIQLTECISFLSLDSPIKQWINRIFEVRKANVLQCQNKLKDKGYDMDDVLREFVDIAFENVV